MYVRNENGTRRIQTPESACRLRSATVELKKKLSQGYLISSDTAQELRITQDGLNAILTHLASRK